MGKNIYNFVQGTMGPKENGDAILFCQLESSSLYKNPTGLVKRGPLGPQSTGRDALGEVYVHIYTHWRLASKYNTYLHKRAGICTLGT